MGLTSKQEHLARLVALEGYNQSDAYREAYDASGMTLATLYEEASRTAKHPDVSHRIAELTKGIQAQNPDSRQESLNELQEIINAPMVQPVRAGDKIAAIDKKAKILGLYKEETRDNRRLQVTYVEIRMPGGRTETQVIEGEGQVVEGEEGPRLPINSTKE